MDKYWESKNWQPTVTETSRCMHPFISLNPKQVESHRERLQVSTQTLKTFPHIPEHWRTRSEILLDLGFPELAAADAYKAIVLINHVFDGGALRSKVWFAMGMLMWIQDVAEGISWEVNFSETDLAIQMVYWLKYERRMAYAQLIFALDHLRSLHDMKVVSAEALEKYPDDSGFIIYHQYATEEYETNRKAVDDLAACRLPEQIVWRATEMGNILIRTYPWAINVNTRTEQSIDAANETLARCSKVLRIRPSTLIVPDSDNVSYGLFAIKDIYADEVVLENRPALAVKASQLEQHEKLLDSLIWKRETGSEVSGSCFNCYGDLGHSNQQYGFICCAHLYFCSKDCKDIAQTYYHNSQCGRNISRVYAAVQEEKYHPSGPEFSGVIWLRLLAICKQGGGHPLQSPLIANLASHEANAGDPWSLEARVIAPLKILEMLGIDVFSNQEYDTWVLETLWQKVRINASGDEQEKEYGCWVDGSHAMFNHSCEDPPMIYSMPAGMGGAKYKWCAERDIKNGEEVFLSYVVDLPESTDERRKMLRGWFSGAVSFAD
ncbi:hypothetical protein DID88_003500 [Monilinia fructigena]|uniref:SET domain-containing protein n=1 Tax=Monilinia fructigena TaxID=38457 RepID=A0A395IU73_9HELO|nr:hypothetical protein DID88_003500 [Monilinia fructigena]